MPGTRKLGRPTAHRNLMLRGMVTNLLQHGSMETTVTRAKEVRALTEKMITLGKRGNLAARRQALAFITKEDTVKKLFDQIAPSYEDRNGGYTVIYRLGPRRGDGAEMALIRLIPTAADEAAAVEETTKGKSKRKADTKIEEPKPKATPKKAAPKAKAVEAVEEAVEVQAEEVTPEETVTEDVAETPEAAEDSVETSEVEAEEAEKTE